MKKDLILKRSSKTITFLAKRVKKEVIPKVKEWLKEAGESFERELKRPYRKTVLIVTLIFIGLFLYFIGTSKVSRLALWGEEVNILLVGTDSTDVKARADTILLISYKPKIESLNILFIPRDTLVYSDKLCNIYSRGGIKHFLNIIGELIKEDILFYGVIDYTGFRKIVDIIGGVEVCIPKVMRYTDRAGGLYINIPPGLQKLDGEKLLQYIRYRSDTGDIGRIERQKEIIRLFLKKLLQTDNPILTSSKVLRELRKHLLTNLSLSDIISLASYIKDINPRRISILKACGKGYKIRGVSYWQVDWEETRTQWRALEEESRMSKVLPKDIVMVRILNGCGKNGLARELQKRLREDKKIDVLEIGNADRFTYDETLILDHVGERDKAWYVKKLLGFGRICKEIDPEVLVDVTIIIGRDFLDQTEE